MTHTKGKERRWKMCAAGEERGEQRRGREGGTKKTAGGVRTSYQDYPSLHFSLLMVEKATPQAGMVRAWEHRPWSWTEIKTQLDHT